MRLKTIDEPISCDLDFNLVEKKKVDCLCSQMSKMIKKYSLFLEWKNTCNFCKLRKKSNTNMKMVIESCSMRYYHQFRDVFSLEELFLSKKVLQYLLLNDSTNISIKDMTLILNKYPDLNLNVDVLSKISVPLTQDSRELLKRVIFSFRRLYSNIYNILHKKEQIDKIITLLDDELKSDQQVMSAIIELYLEIGNYESVRSLLPFVDSFHLYRFYFINSSEFSYNVLKEVFPKVKNVFEVLSYESRSAYNYAQGVKVDVRVDLNNFVDSLLTNVNVSDLTWWHNRTYIIYYDSKTGAVYDGIDASGLTKDFYSTFVSELGKSLIEVDGYLTVPSKPDKKWLLFGILLGRSIINHNISPHINIHPLLSFYLMNFDSEFLLKRIFAFTKDFEIEFFDNLQKILKLPNDQFDDFLKLMQEEPQSKKDYVKSVIDSKYMNQNMTDFINGFQSVVCNRELFHYVTTQVLHRFITQKVCYDINSTDLLSLRSNLFAPSDFKEVFLESLEYLNQSDPVKLVKFIKFWLGTGSLSSFILHPKPKVVNRQNCSYYFIAHTCFNELEYRTTKPTVQRILQSIDSTLLNQDLCLSAGRSMQSA